MKNIEKIIRNVEFEEIKSITCDVCNKEYGDFIEIEEFICINKTCGYGSIFGDMNRISLDICQHCFENLFGKNIRIDTELNPLNDIL